MNSTLNRETTKQVVAAAIFTAFLFILGSRFSNAESVHPSDAIQKPGDKLHSAGPAAMARPRYTVSISPDQGLPNYDLLVSSNSRGEVATQMYLNDYWGTSLPCVVSRKATNFLSTLGGRDGSAYALNNHGQVVGGSYTADYRWHACMWEKGKVRDLSSGFPGMSQAFSINEKGQAVGFALDSPYLDVWLWLYAVLWQDGESYNLNDCIDHDLAWRLWQAERITDRGEIYVLGFLWSGELKMFLLTPDKS